MLIAVRGIPSPNTHQSQFVSYEQSIFIGLNLDHILALPPKSSFEIMNIAKVFNQLNQSRSNFLMNLRRFNNSGNSLVMNHLVIIPPTIASAEIEIKN